MNKIGRKLLASLSAFALLAVLLIPASASAAVYVPPHEPDSPSNPIVLSAGDWSYPTLTPGDVDYFRFVNTFSYTRTYTLIVESPDGASYIPSSISGSGIVLVNPVRMEAGYFQFDIVVNPGAVVNIEVSGAGTPFYSPNPYFVLLL
ncbi:hypothetical protein [Cohnella cellulosilytica]|uniref:Uncharacterized protein n=1 Tax=Cohnella cellulosilytica TaxID=986710 RepID=A0ABW2FEF0_9BACL